MAAWQALILAALLGAEAAWWLQGRRMQHQLDEAWDIARGCVKRFGTAQELWGLLLDIDKARCYGWTATEHLLRAAYNERLLQARVEDAEDA